MSEQAKNVRQLLVAFDDQDTVELLQSYFSGHGYAVHAAASGPAALADARRLAPDLVLLDTLLPEKDGLAVCRELRASPRTSHIPVVFVSDRAAQGDRVAGLTAGAQDYITKPFDLEELRLRVHNLIARAARDNLLDPRSGLPTGRLVDEQLRRVGGQAGWQVVEARVVSFQPFVDVNGFAAGDNVLKMAARLLRETVEALGTPEDFIGHPANDTFLVLTAAGDAGALASRLAERFNADVQAHYSFMDREQGYLLMRDRRGDQMVQVPLMTLEAAARAA